MNQLVLIIPVAAFAICMVIHVIVWRICRPAKRVFALTGIFILLPAALGLSSVISMRHGLIHDPFSLMDIELAAALLLHLSLAIAYIATYPAFEAISPSLAMVLAIGSEGISHKELLSFFCDDELFEPRINDLLQSSLVKSHGEKLSLTSGGNLLAYSFILFRTFLGLKKGEG